MLASPAVVNSCAKLRSAWPVSRGMPSSRSRLSGNTQQEAAVRAFGKPLLQFVPGDFKLSLGALVLEAVEPDVLHQNVQAVHKGACRGYPALSFGVGGEDM